MVSLVTEQLDSLRLKQVTEFMSIFRKCELMADFSDVSIAVPRTVQRQTMRSNVEHNSPEEYFRKSNFLPFLGGLLQELHDRFQGKSKDCIKAIVLAPSNLQDYDAEAVNTINGFYLDDMPYLTNFNQEIQLWKCYWSTEKTKVNAITSTLEHLSEKKSSQMFPNITRILTILLTTASTSATVEGANSSLRYIKTDFRNSLTENQFNALILMYVHKDIKLDREKFIDRCAAKYPRQMLLQNPL